MTIRRFIIAFVILVMFGFGFQIGLAVRGYQDENIVNDALATDRRLPIEEAVWRASRAINICRDVITAAQEREQ
jgi:hypothetical protein